MRAGKRVVCNYGQCKGRVGQRPNKEGRVWAMDVMRFIKSAFI